MEEEEGWGATQWGVTGLGPAYRNPTNWGLVQQEPETIQATCSLVPAPKISQHRNPVVTLPQSYLVFIWGPHLVGLGVCIQLKAGGFSVFRAQSWLWPGLLS